MEENASERQVHLVSRTTGEGVADFLMTWGPWFEHEEARGARGANGRGNSICPRKLSIFLWYKSDCCGGNASFYRVHPVYRTRSDQRVKCSKQLQGGGQGGGWK